MYIIGLVVANAGELWLFTKQKEGRYTVTLR